MVVLAAVEAVDDPRLREFVGLTDAELRRGVEGAGGRFDCGLFIVEGTLAINVLLAQAGATSSARRRWSVRSVLVTEKKLAELDLDQLASERVANGEGADGSVPVYVAPQYVLNEVVGFDLHRGAVAAVDRPPPLTAAEVMAGATSLAMIEGVNDQENLGVIFRNAAALGADAVLLSPTACDPLYRRTVRVSMGHALTVPFARTQPWPAAVDEVRAAGFTTVALTPAPDATPIDEIDLTARRVAVLLGAEGPGLSHRALAAADHRVRIPMRKDVDSLNVANAAAIAFHRLLAEPA